LHDSEEKGEYMDLMKYIEIMRRYNEREGYYPAFGETRRREQRDSEGTEAEQPTLRRLVPRNRRRPWK
jgi:hypothetical protein